MALQKAGQGESSVVHNATLQFFSMRLRDQAATFELRTQLRWSDQLLETPETTALSLYFSAGCGQQTATREKSGEYSNGLKNNFLDSLGARSGMFLRLTLERVKVESFVHF